MTVLDIGCVKLDALVQARVAALPQRRELFGLAKIEVAGPRGHGVYPTFLQELRHARDERLIQVDILALCDKLARIVEGSHKGLERFVGLPKADALDLGHGVPVHRDG